MTRRDLRHGRITELTMIRDWLGDTVAQNLVGLFTVTVQCNLLDRLQLFVNRVCVEMGTRG